MPVVKRPRTQDPGHRLRPADRGPGVLYITFDNVDVGKAEAEAILAKVPKGNYVLIKGDPGDANASTFLPQGWDKAGLKAKVDAGDIKILGRRSSPTPGRPRRRRPTWKRSSTRPSPTATRSTPSWPRTTARRSASSQALTAKSYGIVPVSGQDGDTANLNNVALGKQYVDVWKNANELGKAAGAAALQLCKDKTIADVKIPDGVIDAAVAPDNLAAQDFDDAGRQHRQVRASSSAQPVTQENLQMVHRRRAGSTKDELCKGVDRRPRRRRPASSRSSAVELACALRSRYPATQGARLIVLD